MDSLNPPPPELTLDLNHKQTHQTPKSVYVFLREISTIPDFSLKKSKAGEYVHGLEEEMKKIEVFKRELPLSMLLLNDAIEALKEEVRRCRTPEAQPMMKEFIPLPGNLDEGGRAQMEKDSRDKKNWMSSAQLWSSNCSSDSNSNIISGQRQHPVERVEEDRRSTSKNPFTHWKGEGAFEPFKGYSGGGSIVMNKKKEDTEVKSISSLSLLLPNLKAPMDPCLFSKSKSTPIMHKVLPDVRMPSPSPPPPPQLPQPPQQLQRKQRRCWSPELHRRFVSALQQLGGSQAATPKQIRELMKVDGLTNDEVKSHLQKYRLHTRRSSNGSAGSNQSVVVLGGLWMPQDNECEKSHSDSPQGPLQLASTTGGNSMEDDEDDKSETYSWKGHRSSEEDDEA